MLHNLFKQNVYLDKEQHRYWHNNGDEYVSFTKAYGFLADKFDIDKIAPLYGNKIGMTSEEVMDKWTKQRDEGTRLDQAVKLYAKTGQILADNSDIKDIVIKVSEKYKTYHTIYDDVIVYNEDSRTAGEVDRMCLVSKYKDSPFIMSDFKRFEKDSTGLYEHKGKRWLNQPFDHLHNTKYIKIAFQLSYYAHHAELLSGRKCEGLFIDIVEPDGKNWANHVVPVPYLKTDVQLFLEHYKDKIINLVQPVNLINEDYEF